MKQWQNVIVIQKGDKIELWGSLIELCKAHDEFSYYTIRYKDFPFTYKGWDFNKLQYRTKA